MADLQEGDVLIVITQSQLDDLRDLLGRLKGNAPPGDEFRSLSALHAALNAQMEPLDDQSIGKHDKDVQIQMWRSRYLKERAVAAEHAQRLAAHGL